MSSKRTKSALWRKRWSQQGTAFLGRDKKLCPVMRWLSPQFSYRLPRILYTISADIGRLMDGAYAHLALLTDGIRGRAIIKSAWRLSDYIQGLGWEIRNWRQKLWEMIFVIFDKSPVSKKAVCKISSSWFVRFYDRSLFDLSLTEAHEFLVNLASGFGR